MNNFYLMDTDPKYEYLLDAAEIFMLKLLPKHRTLDISIELLSELEGKAEGFTQNLDDLSKPKEFLISLSESAEDIIKTLAHECIHVKQYVRTLEYCEYEAYAKETELALFYKKEINENITQH